MNLKIFDPISKSELTLKENGLYNLEDSLVYPKKEGVFRIVSGENYTDNFGLEWNLFQKTQIDKYSNLSISRDRFFAQTGWKGDLSNQNILEVGSGAGRFSQIVLDHTQANLYSVDYSSAVDANFKNNGPNNRFFLFQASIYELPFYPNQFDKVFCLGVLQHTPDVKKSIESLIEMVKPGGEIVIDFYPIKGWYTKINAKYILRPFTKRMNQEKLLRIIRRNVPWMIRLYRFNSKLKLSFLNRFIPICDIDKTIPANMTESDFKEWVVLDTFDVYSPQYDQPQRLKKIDALFKSLGLLDVQSGFIQYGNGFKASTVRGTKKNDSVL